MQFSNADRHITRTYYVALCAVLATYVLLRVLVWRETTLFDGHDAVGILHWTRTFVDLDLAKIISLNPDASLFYPFLSAVFSVPAGSLESGARLASLFSSVIVLAAIVGIGRQFAGPTAILMALILLAFNPEILSLSIAVRTEPSYVATVYLGLLVFWLQYKNPTLKGGALLGVIFGLAFLNRLEGILFVAFIPLMLTLYYIWKRPTQYDLKMLFSWSAVFVFVFALFIGIQVWRVSHEMGALAVNGRQAWSLLLHSSVVGQSTAERIYGLYFDPGIVNIKYLHKNFSAAASIAAGQADLWAIARNLSRTLISNLSDLYFTRLNSLFGHLVIVFFAFGMLHLYRIGRSFELVLIVCFIACGLVAPLLHNVVIRHILIIAPIMLLVAGVGIVSVAETLVEGVSTPIGKAVTVPTVALLMTGLAVASWAIPLWAAFNPPSASPHYSRSELQQPIRLVQQFAVAEAARRPRLMARWGFLALYSGAEGISMPYTDYEGLVRYSALNDIDLLYLTPSTDSYPFAATFAANAYDNDFVLLYRGVNAQAEPVSLYRFLAEPPDTD